MDGSTYGDARLTGKARFEQRLGEVQKRVKLILRNLREEF